jgi:hypothetical protein
MTSTTEKDGKPAKEEVKNFGEEEINTLINKLNLDYDNKQREEIIEELGLRSTDKIQIDNLIYKSREKRRQSKFSHFYENVINLFTSPSELILNILVEAKQKLLDYNENRLSDEIEWVIKKIKHEDIYNINVNLLDNVDNNSIKMGPEYENTMKLLSEFSTDNFSRSKKEDIVAARKIGKNRLSIYSERRAKKHSFNVVSPNINYNTNIVIHSTSSVGEGKSPKHAYNTVVHNNLLDLKEENNFTDVMNFNTPVKPENYNSNPLNSQGLENIINSNADGSSGNNAYTIKITNVDEISQINEEDEAKLTLFEEITENHIFDDTNFNIFEYMYNNGRDTVLHNLSSYVFNKYNLFLIVNQSRFDSFLNKIKVGYDFLLPYHNELHAADVLHTSHIFAMLSNLQIEMDLTILDLSGYFIASIIHDYKHPGLNNNFHINKRTDLSRRYNDISVLENYHISSAFKVISQNNSNIFCDIQNEEYRVVRKRIVECVLATDMAKHAKEFARLKIKFENYKNSKNNESYLVSLIRETSEESKFDRQQEVLNFFIHCADISNPAKANDLCKKWTDLVIKEFFEQGDLEKKLNLPVSFLCDRTTTNTPKSQIGFINNIVMPCFNLLQQIAPKLNFLIENLKINSKFWSDELDKERLANN